MTGWNDWMEFFWMESGMTGCIFILDNKNSAVWKILGPLVPRRLDGQERQRTSCFSPNAPGEL